MQNKSRLFNREYYWGTSNQRDRCYEKGKTTGEEGIGSTEEKNKLEYNTTGLLLSPNYPLLGASPDAISDEFVVEIKCPFTMKAVSTYVKDGLITNKFKAQIHLQMILFGKTKGVFCVTDPSFEINQEICTYTVDFDRNFIEDIEASAETFWKANIFPMLLSSLQF